MFHVEHSLDVQRILREQGLPITDVQRDLLCMFVDRVIEWNAKINLVSRRDEDQIWFSHVLHSLTPLLYVDLPRAVSLLDLGTGAGFPGIPLAIVRPDLHVTLLDSIRKKSIAVADICSALELRNVEVITSRAEELAKRSRYAKHFDCVIARAVAPLRELVRWSRPLVRSREKTTAECGVLEGRSVYRPRVPSLLAMKGGDLLEEIRQARVKEGASDVEVIDIVFRGSEEIGLEEKKLVVVSL